MKIYYFTDGFKHVTDNGLNAEQIKADEKEHGVMLCMKNNGKIILCTYGEKGGLPTWKVVQRKRLLKA